VITCGDPEPRMPVDDAAILGRNRNVGEEATNETKTDCNPAHRADHSLLQLIRL
jgi:hypothetical protein